MIGFEFTDVLLMASFEVRREKGEISPLGWNVE